MIPRAAELIERLRLVPHPEGGHYAEAHRSTSHVDPLDGREHRAALTSIYFLLQRGEVSRWHRVASDEVWCHLEGAPIKLHRLDGVERTLHSTLLGPTSAQMPPQCTVHAHAWQAARSTGDYSLAACMVGPGFDFADFELMPPKHPLRDWIAAQHAGLASF